MPSTLGIVASHTIPPVFIPGLKRTRYNGYFTDNPNWFQTASVLSTDTNLSPISMGAGGDNFSVQWVGYFTPTTTETYTFYTNSDDASYLWIGSIAEVGYTTANAVVKNPGVHGAREQSGSIALVADVNYPIRIQYGDAGGRETMIVSISTPTISKTSNLGTTIKQKQSGQFN